MIIQRHYGRLLDDYMVVIKSSRASKGLLQSRADIGKRLRPHVIYYDRSAIDVIKRQFGFSRRVRR